jgi:membrane protein
VGAAVLFLTTVLAISNIETSLNRVWGVTQERGIVRRLSDYLAVLVVAPLLLGVGVSLAGSLQSQWVVQQMLERPWFAQIYDLGLRQIPLVVLALAFAFLNWFLPNTRVSFWSALLGGVIAAVLVVTAQRLYIDFSVGVARANAVFGGFAALPLLFVWIYLFWSIFLFGAEIAFAHQNLALYRREVRGPRLGAAEREAVGLRVALEIARAFRRGTPAWDADRLSDAMSVPVRTVRDVIAHLHGAGILSAVGAEDREGGWQLARSAAAVTVIDVLAALRGARQPVEASSDLAEAAEAMLAEMRDGARRAAGSRTLEDVLERLDGPIRVSAQGTDEAPAGMPADPASGGAGDRAAESPSGGAISQ